MEGKQLNLFELSKQIINPAKVPDKEISTNNFENKMPTVEDILTTMEKGTYKVGNHELLADTFECGALAISNKFDFHNFSSREEKYLQIMKKHTPDVQNLISEIFAQIYALLTTQIYTGFGDHLGELYMRSETSNSKSGQFFTPYHVSKLCAESAVNADEIQEYIENDKILTLHEPACGSGGMIIALADILYNYHFNISRNLFVECGDIDSRCVHMAYLQLSLAGIPAVVYHRNGLTLETWDKWETPAYIMQYMRFEKFYKGKKYG